MCLNNAREAKDIFVLLMKRCSQKYKVWVKTCSSVGAKQKAHFPMCLNHKNSIRVVCISDHLCTPPKNGSPVNHRSPSNALSTVLHSIPAGRKQKKIPAALKEVCVANSKYYKLAMFASIRLIANL